MSTTVADSSPIIHSMLFDWRALLPESEAREVVDPLIARARGSSASSDIEDRRAWMVLDWLVRVNLRSRLEGRPEMAYAAKVLRDTTEIMSRGLAYNQTRQALRCFELPFAGTPRDQTAVAAVAAICISHLPASVKRTAIMVHDAIQQCPTADAPLPDDFSDLIRRMLAA